VRQLRDEGRPIRDIAREVFGDARFRGRVERILHARRVPLLPPAQSVDPAEFESLNPTAQLRLLVERRRRQWLVSGTVPSMSELKALLEIEQRLAAQEHLERLHDAGRKRTK
jgi:hypothetical protein